MHYRRVNIDGGKHVLVCFETRKYFEWIIKQLLNSAFVSFENHADDTQPHSVIADYVPACLCFRGFALVGPFVVMIYQMLKKDFLIFFVIYLIFVIGFSQGKWTVCRIHLASSLIDKLSNRTDSCFWDVLKMTSLINWTLSIVLFFLPLLLRKFTTYRWYWLRNFTCVSIFMTYFQQCSLSWGVMKIARYKKIFLRAGLLRG